MSILSARSLFLLTSCDIIVVFLFPQVYLSGALRVMHPFDHPIPQRGEICRRVELILAWTALRDSTVIIISALSAIQNKERLCLFLAITFPKTNTYCSRCMYSL
ncbi:uncharacterized protein FA14DRAFT_9057 [Meira miltonrushii]|uniref:Uncharacterized protein n=1 Tax=Meira miltonrushii TaxID=1280837 RepID=A0A316VHL6_9BASI|nr:uncharacterized protein FA14DRAFT_9057 [Meira miltonrushii]PWN37036.1 hypothetical protein FA14DRAFT_9057 [Meira miltonrushii]